MSALAGNAAWRALSDAPGKRLPEPGRAAGPLPEGVPLALQRIGISADQVQAALARSAEAQVARWRPEELERRDPDEVAYEEARNCRKAHWGCKGMPKHIVMAMYLDYLHLGSLSKVARLYRRTRQSIWDIFRRAGLKMNERQFHARVVFDGVAYRPGKGGYYRADGDRRLPPLHYAMWEKFNGRKVPEGWQVTFTNGDNTDFRSENLVCLPIDQVTLLHYRRRYPDRPHEPEARRRLPAHQLAIMRLPPFPAFIAKGLRSDGKPRRRPAGAPDLARLPGGERRAA